MFPTTELATTVRRLLEQCPGESLCDACLAFACSVSLTEMRAVTAALAQDRAFTRPLPPCASCRRQTITLAWHADGTPEHPVKCTHCSKPLGPDEDVEVIDSETFHHRCWMRLTTAQTVRASKALSRRSMERIRKSRELMGLDPIQEALED